MADRRRAELVELVADACEAVNADGFPGLMEQPVLKIFTELHKLNQTTELSKLLSSLEDAATRQISSRAPPGFPDLMVIATLLLDVLGPAGPPEGADSPLDPACIVLLRDKAWELSALRKQVEALRDYNPEADAAADEEEGADGVEAGEEEVDDNDGEGEVGEVGVEEEGTDAEGAEEMSSEAPAEEF
ncbi:hypothetical protein TSOC_004066 [Tetrabaena socialis]|uniref:Uncharacterized protein n=1 Tax=Tetrabaena socialis TaxID=47790 RepID=A0A2J8A9Y2_9CHLO|nr:hypothetical protein TSOC_004066 [Tetrabaena socialis]|eukprot:PNH09321.1 hypothetical protein TSOC_004066 [Tetrabaena socialis]